MENLAANAMTWSGSKGTYHLHGIAQSSLKQFECTKARVFSFLDELALQIRSLLLGTNLAPGMVQAATEKKKYFKQGEQWSCYLDIDKRGNYILRISSHDLSLEGTQLRLVSKNWQREIILN